MWFKGTSADAAEEASSHGLILMKFMYRIKVTSPIILTNYSGHITNAMFKRMVMSDDPLKWIVHISPLYAWSEGRYLLTSPTPLQSGIYGFSATTSFCVLDKMVNLVNQTHVELEGVKCQIENIEFKPININTLRSSTCPEFFYLTFKTPTNMGKKPMSLRAKMKIYELLPLPTYVFGTLASTWNSIVGDESLKIDIKKYLEWVRGNVTVIPPFKLTSYTVRLGGGREMPGFMGRVGYSSINPDSYEHYITVLLARLSEFTGTGSGRRLGLGVTVYKEGSVGSGDENSGSSKYGD